MFSTTSTTSSQSSVLLQPIYQLASLYSCGNVYFHCMRAPYVLHMLRPSCSLFREAAVKSVNTTFMTQFRRKGILRTALSLVTVVLCVGFSCLNAKWSNFSLNSNKHSSFPIMWWKHLTRKPHLLLEFGASCQLFALIFVVHDSGQL